MTPFQLELLSPARDLHIGKEAILHGADAVYLGGPEFGARHNAGNSIADIAQLVEFAHQFHAKIFIALNTILHDRELEEARALIYQLYDAGVDALIIQDMGILELDIPPIELHASTQTDIRSLEKAQFLSEVGFSQLVLARELSLSEIKAIHTSVDAILEFFIHGALCVAFSGQCYISHAQTGRSANRGDCSQACRLPYTLKDKEGRVIAFEKHLLSMKDNNQSQNISALIDAGIRSFKIEGRYKDAAYVKNITAHYRQLIDTFIEENNAYSRSSKGISEYTFIPNPDKTFHRGTTDYFIHGRQEMIGAFDSPKFTGLPIGTILQHRGDALEVKTDEPLHNGDGLNVLIKRDVIGFRANSVKEIGVNHYLIYVHDMPEVLRNIRKDHPLNRNLDIFWQKLLQNESATRKIGIDIEFYEENQQYFLLITCDKDLSVQYDLVGEFELAKNRDKALSAISEGIQKVGDTYFSVKSCQINVVNPPFIPVSMINQYRRDALEQLISLIQNKHPRGMRKNIGNSLLVNYPEEAIGYLANVYNHKAREFYRKYGVKVIAPAYEAHEEKGEVPVMITKHCLRYSFNLCPKQAKGVIGVQGQIRADPMELIYNNESIRLEFKCRPCEMHVMGKIKPHILKQALVGSL